MREFVIDPYFSILRILLPPLTDAFPSCTPIITGSLNCQLYFMRLFFPATSEDRSLRSRAVNDLRINCRPKRLPKFKPPDDISSAFRGAVAFTVSVLADIVSLTLDQRKMNKWWQALIDFKGYLDTSGIGAEWDQAISKPLSGGRLLSNLKVLHDVQLELYSDRAKQIASISDDKVHSAVLEGRRYVVIRAVHGNSHYHFDRKADAIRHCWYVLFLHGTTSSVIARI